MQYVNADPRSGNPPLVQFFSICHDEVFCVEVRSFKKSRVTLKALCIEAIMKTLKVSFGAMPS